MHATCVCCLVVSACMSTHEVRGPVLCVLFLVLFSCSTAWGGWLARFTPSVFVVPLLLLTVWSDFCFLWLFPSLPHACDMRPFVFSTCLSFVSVCVALPVCQSPGFPFRRHSASPSFVEMLVFCRHLPSSDITVVCRRRFDFGILATRRWSWGFAWRAGLGVGRGPVSCCRVNVSTSHGMLLLFHVLPHFCHCLLSFFCMCCLICRWTLGQAQASSIGLVVMFWKREPADSCLSRFGGEHLLVDSFGEYQVNTEQTYGWGAV